MPADKAFEMTASLQRELETLRLRPNITSEPSVLGDGLRFIDADADGEAGDEGVGEVPLSLPVRVSISEEKQVSRGVSISRWWSVKRTRNMLTPGGGA